MPRQTPRAAICASTLQLLITPQHSLSAFDDAARSALLEKQRELSPRSRLAEGIIRTLALGSIQRASRHSP